jgi:hypothetical protein
MEDANIPDIAADPKYMLKVQDKFKLENSDEQAGQAFQLLITESVSALFPQITETIHRWAQVCCSKRVPQNERVSRSLQLTAGLVIV